MDKNFNILTIDGGGIKGMRSLYLINYLETKTGKKACQIFDLIAGTSTGGIIAVMLSVGYTASDIIRLYQVHAAKIFEKKFLRFGIFRPRFSDHYFNKILKDYLADKRLSHCLTNIIIPAYDIDKMDKFLFKNDGKQDFSLFDVVRATAAAQSYFSPHEINGIRYIDGGNVINNPSMVCYVEYLKKWAPKPINLISVGTGRQEDSVPHQTNQGLLFWAKPTVEILMTEQSQQTDYFMSKILYKNYLRLDPLTSEGSKQIDDVSPTNLANLKRDGQNSVAFFYEKLNNFILLINT